ncbi:MULTISPECIES: DUF1510 family protein [Sporosarcina]|uniref:DUF1510 domain-containing protein n=1 Tax=Sporosarcina newyorkensis TaxID=759851 RepID=A0A1T4XEG2_9BACL|nr:DUF1510 family protein [Sporosarcina newyorkensis]SKA87954.1 Protein of unknown function [Sporosarcina newyorkensis]
MADREPNFSRMSRKKGNKANKILNILIGIVVLLILIVGVTFIIGDDKEEASKDQKQEPQQTEEAPDDNVLVEEQPDEDDTEETNPDEDTNVEDEEEEGGKIVDESESLTVTPSNDSAVKETIVNSNWKPIGTKQTGEHVSKYDGESDDWHEKKAAISYATGLPEDQLIYWRIQNGGSPQKSEGIVSSLDKSEKYKVYIEWVDGEGWTPVKMDVLNTLETK